MLLENATLEHKQGRLSASKLHAWAKKAQGAALTAMHVDQLPRQGVWELSIGVFEGSSSSSSAVVDNNDNDNHNNYHQDHTMTHADKPLVLAARHARLKKYIEVDFYLVDQKPPMWNVSIASQTWNT